MPDTQTFDELFASAEAKAPRLTEVPEGEHLFVVKRHNRKEGEKGTEIGFHLYFPAFNLHEWANYGNNAALPLKNALTGMGVDVKDGLNSALEQVDNRRGKLRKGFVESKSNGKTYPRYTFLEGEAGAAAEDLSIPF